MADKHEKQSYSVGIIGMGFVGRGMKYLFPEAMTHDIRPGAGANTQLEINTCEIVFIAVPTDGKEDGSVDLSAVYEVLGWLDGPIAVIKSTVPAEFTDDLVAAYKGPVVFNPEFLTEKNWRQDIDNETRVIIGTYDRFAAKRVMRNYQKVCNHGVTYQVTDPKTAMLTKYVGNAFLAVKVTFANQVYDLCQALGVDYDELRELWLLDHRVGRSHTMVTEQRGFGGYCLPKDLAGLIITAKSAGVTVPIMDSAECYNNQIRKSALFELS